MRFELGAVFAPASPASADFVGNSVHVSTKNLVDTSILKRSTAIKVPRQDAYFASIIFDSHTSAPLPGSIEQLPHSFVFRVALCGYLGSKNRIADGASRKLRHEVLRNDLVDSFHCAIALYFDGFFASDHRATAVYREARILTDELFLRAKDAN